MSIKFQKNTCPSLAAVKLGSICPLIFVQNICSMSPKIFGRSLRHGLALYISRLCYQRTVQELLPKNCQRTATKERIKLSEMEVAGQLYQIRKLKVEKCANYAKCKNVNVSHHHEPDLQYKWKSKPI